MMGTKKVEVQDKKSSCIQVFPDWVYRISFPTKENPYTGPAYNTYQVVIKCVVNANKLISLSAGVNFVNVTIIRPAPTKRLVTGR